MNVTPQVLRIVVPSGAVTMLSSPRGERRGTSSAPVARCASATGPVIAVVTTSKCVVNGANCTASPAPAATSSDTSAIQPTAVSATVERPVRTAEDTRGPIPLEGRARATP
jgi:hypothetical protein